MTDHPDQLRLEALATGQVASLIKSDPGDEQPGQHIQKLSML